MNQLINNVLKTVQGPVTCIIEKQSFFFADKIDVKKMAINDCFKIISIQVVDGILTIQMKKDNRVPNDLDDNWVKEYKERTGKEPSIFDGD